LSHKLGMYNIYNPAWGGVWKSVSKSVRILEKS
jgi:hypothetical protein